MSNGFLCSDNEYVQLGQAYGTLYSNMERDYVSYLSALSALTTAVPSGHVGTNLRTFRGSARSAQSALESKADSASNVFISSLRAADNLG